MSIINEAIKKASKESIKKDNGITAHPTLTKDAGTPLIIKEKTETRWAMMIILSIIISVSLLGSVFLYKYISKNFHLRQDIEMPGREDASLLSSKPTARQDVYPHIMNTNYTLELNGVVCGPEGKWAIINDRIINEGDIIPGYGRLFLIEKDSVRIKKDDGEEIILKLR